MSLRKPRSGTKKTLRDISGLYSTQSRREYRLSGLLPSSGGIKAPGSVEIESPEYWGMGKAKIIDPIDQIDFGEYIAVRRA